VLHGERLASVLRARHKEDPLPKTVACSPSINRRRHGYSPLYSQYHTPLISTAVAPLRCGGANLGVNSPALRLFLPVDATRSYTFPSSISITRSLSSCDQLRQFMLRLTCFLILRRFITPPLSFHNDYIAVLNLAPRRCSRWRSHRIDMFRIHHRYRPPNH